MFDRFDICEAYACLEMDWHSGGILWERPSNRRRSESIGVQLDRMRFRPRPSLSTDTLSENGRAIYDAAVIRLRLAEKDWQYEVQNGDTSLGYAEWVYSRSESEQFDAA